MPVALDPRLQQDSYELGCLGSSRILLMRNALYPWFVIVPDTMASEFYELDDRIQQQLLTQINVLSAFIKTNFICEKLNVATIGNIVSQMHIHVIARHKNDASWPGVVWGQTAFAEYQAAQLEQIKAWFVQQLVAPQG